MSDNPRPAPLRRHRAQVPAAWRDRHYDLTINGELWACVEWSPARRAWCVQDASGRCLAHCDAIHGENVDAGTAVRLAKVMIRDGRMPSPEQARQQLEEHLQRDRLGEPWQPLPEPVPIKRSDEYNKDSVL